MINNIKNTTDFQCPICKTGRMRLATNKKYFKCNCGHSLSLDDAFSIIEKNADKKAKND